MSNKNDEVLAICRNFIEDKRIWCAETIYQSDRVIEGAYEFIESLCNVVGYLKEEEEDD